MVKLQSNVRAKAPSPFQYILSSVADPGCLSRILIFYSSWIPDPKTSTKERGEKKFDVIPFFVGTNFTIL
jgi:hypothetical protein